MDKPTIRELCERVPKGPYFVDHHKGTREDFEAHAKSGLATVDTGRSSDWPIAYFCEWPQAQLIARLDPQTVLAVAAALEEAARLPNQMHAATIKSKHALALLNATPTDAVLGKKNL